MDQLIQFIHTIVSENPLKLILSKPTGGQEGYKKIVLTLKGGRYQTEKFTQTQVFHETLGQDALRGYLSGLLNTSFLQLNSFHENISYDLLLSKKGRASLIKHPSSLRVDPSDAHNRTKSYLFKEGTVIQPLIDMGIFTKEGKVVRSMYDKYRQINRFVELIDDAVKTSEAEEWTVVDFGCGKSYLTFLLYYYFTEIKKIKVQMIGLDLKQEVIDQCNETARKYAYAGLTFQGGDIGGFKADSPVDVVISLHACDTATDYALCHSVLLNAKMIFSVPCCQHEFNHQMRSDTFSLFTRYGIIREHLSSALTDAVRANLLICCGYQTQLLEFIDSAHTPKNILIRSVKANLPKETKDKALNEVLRVTDEFGLKPTLLTLLQSAGLIVLPDGSAKNI
jgi:SAM-dependent methyltransferase